tara:strand:+ start:1308 stop:2237 length:930 start_codon:yes stop_codon:yes gene_type:complete
MKTNNSSIKKSIYLLKKNECVGIPTETVYGLAANAYSSKAILKVFRLKRRPRTNPLIVHYYDIKFLKNDCYLNNRFMKLYKLFCPGPITFILKKKPNSNISKFVTNSKKTLAVRFPKHRITRLLLKNISFPLAAPSANVSTSISPVTKKDVLEEFGSKIKYVIDGGKTKVGLESTIIDVTGRPKILRVGGLDLRTINKSLKLNLNYNFKNKYKAPGQSKLHYSPGIPIILNVKKPKKFSAYILISKRKYSNKNYFYLTQNRNLNEAGQNLYKILRNIKRKKYKLIEVENIPNQGLGLTINDRLKRASYK